MLLYIITLNIAVKQSHYFTLSPSIVSAAQREKHYKIQQNYSRHRYTHKNIHKYIYIEYIEYTWNNLMGFIMLYMSSRVRRSKWTVFGTGTHVASNQMSICPQDRILNMFTLDNHAIFVPGKNVGNTLIRYHTSVLCLFRPPMVNCVYFIAISVALSRYHTILP